MPVMCAVGVCQRPPSLSRPQLLRVAMTSLLFFSNVIVGLLSLRVLHVSV